MKKTYITPATEITYVQHTENILQESAIGIMDGAADNGTVLTKEHTPAPSWDGGSVWNEW